MTRAPDRLDEALAGTQPAAEEAPSTLIGRFEVVRLLGRGRSGAVYQARDTELGRHVALKLMRSGANASALVEAAAKLNHPNVVTIHDHGTHEGAPYLVMELLTGTTLARRLEDGPLAPAEEVGIATQICRGLVHAHAAGVVHGALGAASVFLRDDGQVKILDFGLGGGEGQDERADVRACGAMLPGVPAAESARELLDALVRLGQPAELTARDGQPYRYLEHFLEADAPWFFGRERETVRLEQMLAARPLIALVGPSGAGKSSLLHAGLLPRLRQAGRWTVIAMRPGGDPLRLLSQRLVETCGETALATDASALAEAPGRAGRVLRRFARDTGTRVLLFVDQLEELVTQVHASATRRAFVQALLSVADDPDGPTRVVVALRDDFLVRLSKGAELREALVRNMVLLGPPDADGLGQTLRGPAARLGYDFEAGLVDDMLAAVAGEAAPLPLLEVAASRLWERRDAGRRLLTRAGLEAAGGVAGILAAHAGEVLHGLAGAASARRLLCELVTDEHTRRRVRRDELLARFADPKATGKLLERLVSGRLVTSYHGEGGEWVELAHESLITGWAQLAAWLDEDRDDRRFRARLLGAATVWEERRRAPELLWRGETLAEALTWRRRYQGREAGALSRREQDFLARAEARARRARRIRRSLAVAAIAVALGVAAGSLLAVRGYRAAERARTLRELVRAAAAAEDPLTGALILAELEGQPEPPGGLAAAAHLAAQPLPLATFRAKHPILAGALSPDGQWAVLALRNKEDNLVLWRVDGTGETRVLRGHQKPLLDVSFSRDGTRIVTGGYDHTARIWRTDGRGEPIVLYHGHEVDSARFTPDETHVLTAAPQEHVFRLWRADGQGPPVVFRHEKYVHLASMSPDGTRVVTTGDDAIRLWRVDGTPLLSRALPTSGARFSPDGTRILASHDQEMRVWTADLTSSVVLPGALPPGGAMDWLVMPPSLWSPDGTLVAHPTAHGVGVSHADGSGLLFERGRGGHGDWMLTGFSPDGDHLLAIDDHEIRVWRTHDGSAPLVLQGHGYTRNVAGFFSPDGARLLTISPDGGARVWDVRADPPGARILRESRGITSVAVSPDGGGLLTTSIDGQARLWPVAGGEPTVLGQPGPRANAGAFHPDGSRVAIAHVDGLSIWPARGGDRLAHPLSHTTVLSTSFSPDGRWLAATERGWEDLGMHVILMPADGSGEAVKHSTGSMIPEAIAFSPDSRHVAVSLWSTVLVHRTDWNGEPVVLPVVGGAIESVFHPRGDTILTSGRDDKLQLWTLDGKELPALARPGGGPVAFDRDGTRIAVGLRDGSTRVTRLDGEGDPVVLRGHRMVNDVAFLPDGRLVTAGDTTARIWTLDWRSLVASLRAATTACLAPDQRVIYLREPETRARAAWEACERRFGRPGGG